MNKNRTLATLGMTIFICIGCGSNSSNDADANSTRERYIYSENDIVSGKILSAREDLVVEMESSAGSTTFDSSTNGVDEIKLQIEESGGHQLRLELEDDKDIEASILKDNGEEMVHVNKASPKNSAILIKGLHTLKITNKGPNSHILFIRPGSTVITDKCLHCNLAGQNLSGAQLGNVVLDGSNLSNASLVGASCSKTSFRNVNLSGASMASANCPNAYFAGANLDGTNFNGANLANADLLGAHWNSDTSAFNANLTGIHTISSFPDADSTVGTDLVITAEHPLSIGSDAVYTFNNVHIESGGAIYLHAPGDIVIQHLTVDPSPSAHIISRGLDGEDGKPGKDGYGPYYDNVYGVDTVAQAAGPGGNGGNGGDANKLLLTLSQLTGDLKIESHGGKGGKGGKGGDGYTNPGAPSVVVPPGTPSFEIPQSPPAENYFSTDGGTGGDGGHGGAGAQTAVAWPASSGGTVELIGDDANGGESGPGGLAGVGPGYQGRVTTHGAPGRQGVDGEVPKLFKNEY